jgi:hypothetical protein
MQRISTAVFNRAKQVIVFVLRVTGFRWPHVMGPDCPFACGVRFESVGSGDLMREGPDVPSLESSYHANDPSVGIRQKKKQSYEHCAPV